MRKTKPQSKSPDWALLLPLFYASLSLLAFSRCLIFGQAYFDNDLLAQFGPWRLYLRDQLLQGHFPLWNPYLLGGQPFFADLQNMMFYPVNYLTLFFPVGYGLSVFFFLHMALAAWGMHLWLRKLSLSEGACRLGALLFAFSGFFWLEIIHPPVLAAFAWLPWLFLALERLSHEPKPQHAFYAGFAFAMLFVCGSFQMTIGAFYGGTVYFFFRLVLKDKYPGNPFLSPERVKKILILGFFLLWGALPLLGQFIPTLEFSLLGDRAALPQDYSQLTPHTSLNPATLYQFLFPRLTLPPGQSMSEAVQNHDTEDNFLASLGYLGVWVPFLALLAFRRKEKGLVIFLVALALFSLLVCLGEFFPLHRLLFEHLPGMSLVRVPFRFLYLFVVPMVVLAAMGFDQLMATVQKPFSLSKFNFPPFFILPLLYFLVAGLLAFYFPLRAWRELLGLILGLSGLGLVLCSPRRKEWGIFLLNLGIILPLFLNGWRDFVPGPASNFDYEKNSKTLNEIAKQIGPYRVIYDNPHMFYPIEVESQKYVLNYPQDASCAMAVKNFGGYDPMMLQAKRDLAPLPMETLIHLGAIKGIITQQDHGEIPGFKKVSFPPFLLYDYQKPLPCVFAPVNIFDGRDRGQRLETLSKPDFDSHFTGILTETLPMEYFTKISKAHDPHLKYRIDQDETDYQRFGIDIDQFSLVVFSETMFPGWKAWVDGKPVRVFTADHLLRGLFVTAGSHEVEFRFEPDWFRPILIGTVLWILLTLAFFWRWKRTEDA